MHAITPYLVKVVDANSGIPQDLWAINGTSLYDYLKNVYFKGILGKQIITRPATSSELGQNYIVSQIYNGTPQSVAGSVDVGVFGFESKIYDTVTRQLAHKKGKDQSDLQPFHFSFYTPNAKNIAHRLNGFLLLYRFNNRGMRSIVMPDLILSFEKAFPGLKLVIEKAVPASVVNSLFKGGVVKRIRIFQNTIPQDLSSILSAQDQKKFLEVETIIKPKPSTAFSDINWALDAIRQRKTADKIFTIPNVTPTKVKVLIGRNGKLRNVNLGAIETISSTIDIESPQIIKSTGHIDPQNWLDEADELVKGLFDESDVSLPPWKSKV